jgi:hypothetical protein
MGKNSLGGLGAGLFLGHKSRKTYNFCNKLLCVRTQQDHQGSDEGGQTWSIDASFPDDSNCN